MFLKKICVFVLSLVVLCESSFVDTLIKCGIKDGECQRNQINNVVKNASASGIPEYKFPPLDPLKIKNVKFTVFEIAFKFDGDVKGVKNCEIIKFIPNIEKGVTTMTINCSYIVLEGKYDVASSSDFIKGVLGDSVHGNGVGKAECENVIIEIRIVYEVVKKGDHIFLSSKRSKLTYTYKVGQVKFAADSIYIGDKESSETIVSLMNKNSEILVKTIGKFIMDIALDYIYNLATLITDNVSVDNYFIEDVTPYLKN